jgi:hypothetical protein
MYDYRRMTPAERDAVVELRRQRGSPLHKPPHLKTGEGWFFISGATYEHLPHFSSQAELTALTLRLLEALQSARLPCGAWVVLCNHYHVLLHAPTLSVVGRAWEAFTAGRRATRIGATGSPADRSGTNTRTARSDPSVIFGPAFTTSFLIQ